MIKNRNALGLLEKDYLLSSQAKFLNEHGLKTAALFYRNMNDTFDKRASEVVLYHLQNCELPSFSENQRLYATNPYQLQELKLIDDVNDYGITVDIYGYVRVDEEKVKKLYKKCNNDYERQHVDFVVGNFKNMYGNSTHIRYAHGGVHNVIDFEFIVDNGISAYIDVINEKLVDLENDNNRKVYDDSHYTYYEKKMFYDSMLDLVHGYIDFHNRYTKKLKAYLDTIDKASENFKNIQRLYNGFLNVPLNKPNSFYEAVLSYQSAMFLSNCFEPGRMDVILNKYYEKDLNDGNTTFDEAVSLLTEIFTDINEKYGHPGAVHATIGGTDKNNKPVYNDITKAAMIAIRGLRMPNLTLRVREDMPNDIWSVALENLSKGYSHPALVNEDLFIDGLINQYNIPFEDAVDYVFGGCSEVIIQGKTMCDSTWTAYNMLDIFEHTMYNNLLSCDTFDEFYKTFKKDVTVTLKDLANQINVIQHGFGETNIWPIHSLFTGCLESGVRFTNGGCTYNFDSTNVYGSTNSINSLYTVKKLFEGELGVSKEEFLISQMNNFKTNPALHKKCLSVQKFGNYNEELNEIASDLMQMTFDVIKTLKGYRGKDGRFMPAIILWVTWVGAGKRVGATPDGRVQGEPLADSAGPMQGTDLEGPTSTLGAALSIPQKDCVGTCVLNIRLDPANFATNEKREKIMDLFKTYFSSGGCQLQVNVINEDDLLDALVNPDKHKDLIVRVGGFSDNFVLLSDDIKNQVIKRVQHKI